MKVHDYMFGVYFLNFMIMCIFIFKLAILTCKCFYQLMISPYVYDIWKKYNM
jgi:hypothetical protein